MWQENIDEVPVGLFLMNNEGEMLRANETFHTLLGYGKEALQGMNFEKILSPGNQFFYYSILYPELHLKGSVEEQYMTFLTAQGTPFPVLFQGRLWKDEKGTKIMGAIMAASQRAEYIKEIRHIHKVLAEALEEKTALYGILEEQKKSLEELNEKLEYLATVDPLTGLWNRRIFMTALEGALEGFLMGRDEFSLCLLDIDHFKRINDTYGHGEGDEVLRGLSKALRTLLPEGHHVARFGGEEFMVMMKGLNEKESKAYMEQFLRDVRDMTFGKDTVTLSGGISTVSIEESTDSLILKADQALYEAKNRGRNKVVHICEI